MAGLWDRILANVIYSGTEKTNKKILEDEAKQGRGFNVEKPTSYRTSYATQKRNKQGRFTSGFDYTDTEIAESMEKPDDGKKLHSVDSTAIASARYDPNDDSLNIAYTTAPGKEYKFKAGGAQGVREWLDAPSKGRVTQEWKKTHAYPGY